MKQLIADEKASPGVVSEAGNSSVEERLEERPEHQVQASVSTKSRVLDDPADARPQPLAPRLGRDRRQDSEQLAHQLSRAQDLPEFVAIVNEHGRSAVARAAAVRPDLMPVVNGEFAHIALSLVDLE